MDARPEHGRKESDMDTKRRKWTIGGAVALVVLGGGTAVAVATAADDRPLTGSTLDRARQAALAHTGGGTVIETEVGDDGAAYGVEVRLPDGSVVEVALDREFRVVGAEADDDGANEDDAGPDDD
jgi:uncharacterized membrane protein YkoI